MQGFSGADGSQQEDKDQIQEPPVDSHRPGIKKSPLLLDRYETKMATSSWQQGMIRFRGFTDKQHSTSTPKLFGLVFRAWTGLPFLSTVEEM